MPSTTRDAAVNVVQAAGAECNRSVPGEWDTTRWRAKQIVKALDEAGLLAPVSPVGADTPSTAVTAEQVDHAAEALKDVRLRIGPGTRALIADGTWETMPLTGAERREIARIVLSASGEVPQ